MKIVQILPYMNVGGVERGVLDLVRFFKNSKVKVTVISGGGRLTKEIENEGAGHYQLPVYKKSPASFILIPKLRKFLNHKNIDIIHARSRIPGWISFFATRGTNTAFITTAHGIYKNKFWSQVMGWGKFVICPSKTVAKHMKETFGVPHEKIVIINRWVDLNKFRFTEYRQKLGSNTIVTIGRMSPSKGYEYLIESFKKIVRFNPYLKLKIIGSPDKSKMRYFNYLKSLVSRYSLNYNIEFVGFKPDIENILKEARILVAPSVIEESFGRVVVEAFACGVPVIATKVGGFAEIIEDKKDGILIEPANSEEIAENILNLLNDFNLANNLVNNARKKVENLYVMDKCMKETEDVYKRTLEFHRILVIKLSSMGDLILSFPALKEIKSRFPNSKLSLLTLKKYVPLVYDCPFIDNVIALDNTYKQWREILKISKDLRLNSFDYILDFQNNRASHLISFLSFPQNSFGYSLRWGFLLNKKVKYVYTDDPLASQEKILKFLGIKFAEKKLIFWERKETGTLELPKEFLIGINVGASSRWESKHWPASQIIQLIDQIHKNLPSFKIVLLGDTASLNLSEQIKGACASAPVNLCGKTGLSDLPQVIKKLKIFITPDTASLHLAEALNIPTIALFGPTNPDRHIVKTSNLYVIYKKLPCSFCYRPQCNKKEKNLCMRQITVPQVFTKVKEIIENEK